jgi:Alginate export
VSSDTLLRRSFAARQRSFARALAIACSISAGLVGAIRAEEPERVEQDEHDRAEKLDLRVRPFDNPDHWMLPGLRADSAWFTGANAWAGNTTANIGSTSHGWAEFGLVPSLDGQYSLGKKGTLFARISGVYTTTQLGLDWGGSNFIDGETKNPQEITLEDAFVRWTSGGLFPSLGNDAIELSVGAQQYNVGTLFLFGNGGIDGGDRGGNWLGLRRAFELAGIASLETGEFRGETVYFRSDDDGGGNTHGVGANIEYDFGPLLELEQLELGIGYWNLFESDYARRDGLNVLDLRIDTVPFAAAPGLGLDGELVKQRNRWKNDSWAASAKLEYDFAKNDVPGAPYVSYRFAYFSGDDQSGDNDNRFDPLYYEVSDWSEWAIGEILGAWVTGNSNISSHILRLRANPIDSVAVNLIYIYTRLNEDQSESTGPGGRPIDPRVVAINDKDLSHELDLIADWAINDYLSSSVVTAVLIPMNGAEDFAGNDEIWTQLIVATTLQF